MKHYQIFVLVFSLLVLVTHKPYVETQKVEAEPAKELTQKEQIVADVSHETLKGPKYTIRVWLWWARKNIPKINGSTIDERVKQWLQSEWSVDVKKSFYTWKNLWDKYKIDYTLPLCIAWADSSLWKALKSKNNVDNVHNNDRWDVKHYQTLEEWIEAIFWNLAKWKYMSGHTIIWTLSWEGRIILWLPSCTEEKDYRKKCYATSTTVHSTNTINCMSSIHDKQITEEYNFRL